MKRAFGTSILLMFLVLVMGCSGSSAPTGASTKAEVGPILEITEKRFDAGEVDYGESRAHTFQITNKGDKPLILHLVRKSCRCGEVKVPSDPIAPGTSGAIVFLWKPILGTTGPYTLSADLETNDPTHPDLRVEIGGRITPTIRFFPEDQSFLDLGEVRPGMERSRTVLIYSHKIPSFEVEATCSQKEGIAIKTTPLLSGSLVEGTAIKCGYRVEVSTTPQLGPGYLRADLRFVLRVPEKPERTIVWPLYGNNANGQFQISQGGEITFSTPNLIDGEKVKVRLEFLAPRDNDRIEIVSREPSFLEVGKPVQLRRGLWEFTVFIPPAHPEAEKLQADHGWEGKLILKSSRDAREVPVRVKWRPKG